MKKKCYPVLLYPARLLARSTPFQGVGTGSIPVQDTKFYLCVRKSGQSTRLGSEKS